MDHPVNPTRIKILFMIDTLFSDKGGTEKQLLGIIERLNRSEFEPYLACLYRHEWMETAKLPCPVFYLDYKGFFSPSIFRSLYRLRQFIQETQINLVHIFFHDSQFVCYLATRFMKRRPAIFSSRRDIGISRPWYHSLYDVFLPLLNHSFDGIIANGENIKAHVLKNERCVDGKIKVIRNGFEVPKEGPVPEIYSKHSPDIWIGIAANLDKVKRYDVFLGAISILKEHYNFYSFHAVILGKGPEEANLKELQKRLKLESCVHFLGSVPNVFDHVRQWDIGVLCSDAEGFSNSLMEYMACGLAVVATSVGGNPELIDAEINGLLCPPGKSSNLAGEISRLIFSDNLRKHLGVKAKEKMKNAFSWERTMRDFEGLYKEFAQWQY